MEESKHVCRVCRKSFPCGRSLGGHMRSHVSSGNNSSAVTAEDSVAVAASVSATGYGLREKRIKTWRVADSGDGVVGGTEESPPNKLCKQCGKAFHSWKALFGHMKCHSERERASVSFEDQDSWTVTESHSDDNEAPRPRTRMRSKRKRTNASSQSFSNISSSVSDIELDQQEVALSLIMLSRGSPEIRFEKKSKASELLCPNNFPRIGIRKSKTKKRDFKSAIECSEEDDRKRNFKFLGSEWSSNKRFHRRGKFECTTCNKIFDSYQALGGHRAGHKKITRDCFVPIDETSENSIKPDLCHNEEISRSDLHERSIYHKSFASEQALDEHKRFHSAEASESRKAETITTDLIDEPVEKIRPLIDLNLPADDAEEAEEDSNNNSDSEFYRSSSSSSPWWARSINNKQEILEEKRRRKKRDGKERDRERKERKMSREGRKKKRNYDSDDASEDGSDSSLSGSDEEERLRVEPEGVVREMTREFPNVGDDLKLLLQMIDDGQAVDIKGISEGLLMKHLKAV